MPTYQTTPYIPWTFPDQAIQMNRKGFQPAKSVPLPQQDMIVGAATPWDEPTRKLALQRLHTNRVKEEGMLFKRNTTDRTQAFDRPAHLSQTRINGKFMAPSYEYTQTPSGLRGGTGLITPEGRAWAKRQLERRVTQLDAIETGDFSKGRREPVNLYPTLDFLDSALSQFLDQWETGAFPGSLVELANKCVQELFKVGATISPAKLTEYVEVIARLQVQADRYASVEQGRYTFKEEKRAILRAVINVFSRFQKLAEEIARVINEPAEVRARVMKEVGSRMLKETGEAADFIRPGGWTGPRPPFLPERLRPARPGANAGAEEEA